jgi:hypothetical protein
MRHPVPARRDLRPHLARPLLPLDEHHRVEALLARTKGSDYDDGKRNVAKRKNMNWESRIEINPQCS